MRMFAFFFLVFNGGVLLYCRCSLYFLASLMRCEKADDCKLLKLAHGQSDVLCLCDRLRRSGFAHLYNEKSTCLMQVFFLVSDRLFSDHCEWSACGSTLDVEQVCSGVGFYSLQVRNGKVSTR